MSPPIYFIFGGPGAGKGTICSRLSQDFNLTHLCVGDLRSAVKQNMLPSETSSQIQQAMKDGKLSPISTILLVLREELLHITSSVLLDGFPHSLEQLEEFEKVFGFTGHAVLFECSQETIEARVLNRGKSSGRVDDNVDTLRKRFAQFE